MNFDVLTVGEKFKSIRKKYGLTQEDVAANDVTREFVSLIEKNKSKLPKNTAIKLLKNIKEKLSKDEKFDIELNLKYLFDEDIKIQKQKILEQCDLAIKEFNMSNYDENKFKFFVEETDDFFVKNSISYEYEKIENVLIKNDISYKQKINMYKDISYIFLKNYDYSNAQIYLLKATSESTEVKNYNDALKFILDRIRVYHQSNNLNDEGILIKYAFKYYHEHAINDNEILKNIYWYAATVCSKLNKFEKCLKYLDLLKKVPFKFTEKDYLDIKNLYSNNLFRNEEYESAKKISLEILDIAIRNSYKDIVSRTYINLTDVCIKLEQYEEAKIYLGKLDKLKHNYTYVSNINVNYSLLELNVKCNNETAVVQKSFKNFIDICDVANDAQLKSKAYKLISQYYIKFNEDELLYSLILNIREEIKDNKICMDNKIYSLLIATLNYFKEKNARIFQEVLTIAVNIDKQKIK